MSARLARLVSIAGLALALGVPRAAAAAKTDVVVLINGDHITGEIKGLSRGKLDYKTDDAGRLSIEWIKVVQITSPHRFELELRDGTRRFGALETPLLPATSVVQLSGGETSPIADVVAIVPVDDSLVSRLQAYIDLGFTLAKANGATTLNADSLVSYRGENLGTSLEGDVYAQSADATEAVSRASAKLTGETYIDRWTPQIWSAAEKNDELNLRLRLTLGSGVSYSAFRTNDTQLSAQAGAAGFREAYDTTDPALSLAGSLRVKWDFFRYDSPKLDAGLELGAFPYLTDLGRVRVDASVRVKYEVFANFDVGLSVSDTFDSRPPEATASKNDYLMSMTIGWSYRR